MPRALPLVVVATLLACGQEPAPAPVAAVADPPAVVAVSTAAPPAAPAPAIDEGPIGVAVCDHYIDHYRRCIAEALPAEERPIHSEVVEGQRLAWARARADEVLAAGLPEACAAARTAARVAVPHCRHFNNNSSRGDAGGS